MSHARRKAGDLIHQMAHARLEGEADVSTEEPLRNTVRALAFDYARALEEGELGAGDVQASAQQMATRAARERMARFRDAHGEPPDLEAMAQARVHALADVEDDVFLRALARPQAGIVFTAHPTFAHSAPVRAAMARLSADADEAAFAAALDGVTHRPGEAIALAAEHEEVLGCIDAAQAANRALIGALHRAAGDQRPHLAAQCLPQPMTIATWVGYDLDGRTDIHWGETLAFRLLEKARQLGVYADALAAVTPAPAGLSALIDRLHRASALATRQAAAFRGELDTPEVVVAAANLLTDPHPDRLTSLCDVREELRHMVVDAPAAVARQLAVVTAEMALYGLGVARIHLRVNAAQVRSALKADLGLTADADFMDRTALATAAEKAMRARAREINFASVFKEQMTARRQLMLCAQILKHVDGDTPIRFLIAECEAPATIMGAVYLARLYGVDERVDISPLFETPSALETGGRFMERLLREPEFVEYVSRRGRVAIQLGFSDSGRFMGQLAANMAIERLHILLAREMGRLKLHDVEAVIFNTHGESMGRGGYPGSLTARFDHLITPWARSRFRHEGIALHAEASFQGGDGFLHFRSDAMARATLGGFYLWASHTPQARPDRFYDDINYSWDVYRGVRQWQEDLFAREDYQTTLGTFAINFLYKTGSRRTRRQSGTSARDAARSLRAIPHNAILQQLAIPCNVSGGLGMVAAREPDRFQALIAASDRMQQLYAMAGHARQLTSLSVFRAYGSLYSAPYWTILARHSGSGSMATRYERVARSARRLQAQTGMESLADHLSEDRRRYDRLGTPARGVRAAEFPRSLYILHALRMALIQRGVLIVAGVPEFTQRHETTRDDLLDRALRLEWRAVASALEVIFPAPAGARDAFSNMNEPASSDEIDHGYHVIAETVIEPLRTLADTMDEITAAIAHHYGAYG